MAMMSRDQLRESTPQTSVDDQAMQPSRIDDAARMGMGRQAIASTLADGAPTVATLVAKIKNLGLHLPFAETEGNAVTVDAGRMHEIIDQLDLDPNDHSTLASQLTQLYSPSHRVATANGQYADVASQICELIKLAVPMLQQQS